MSPPTNNPKLDANNNIQAFKIMSYYNRFTALSTLSKSNNKPGQAKPTTPSTSSKTPPGPVKAPASSSKPRPVGSSALTSRKRATSNPPFSTPPYTPSDDFTTAFVLKTKVAGSGKSSISAIRDGSGSKTSSSKSFPKKGDERKGVSVSIGKSASVEPVPPRDYVVHEGPVPFSEDSFNFYKVLSRPKVWEEDEYDASASCTTANTEDSLPKLVKVSNSPSYAMMRVRQTESEVWGSLRTSTPGASTVPSLTSVLNAEEKREMESELTEEMGELIQRDENNNVISAITNRIFGGLSLFYGPSPPPSPAANSNNPDERESEEKEERKAILLGSGKQGQVSDGSEEKINAQSCPNNIHNLSATLEAGSEPGRVALIPSEIETELQKELSPSSSFRLNCQQRACLEQLGVCGGGGGSASGNSPLEIPIPSMTRSIDPQGEIGAKDSAQLALDGTISEKKSREQEQFHGVSWEHASSSVSLTSEENESYCPEPMPDVPQEVLEDHQTQTMPVAVHDAGTGIDLELDSKRAKLNSLVMAVNSGIDIGGEAAKKKSVRIKGIMKAGSRPETACSLHSTGSFTCLTEENLRRRAIQSRRLPQTYAQLGADYGFPADMSISGLMKDLVPIKWAPGKDSSGEEDVDKDNHQVADGDATVVSDAGDGSSFLESAYNMFHAGLKFATALIGDEMELEPREDSVQYNGYTIRVVGRRLLLESVHVNCDFKGDLLSSRVSGKSSSSVSLNGLTVSTDSLETGCEGRRIRILIRLTRPSTASAKTAQTNSIMDFEHLAHHHVRHADGKWTLVCGDGEDGENLVEISCPTGIHPESLAYGVVNGLVIVDAP